MKEMVQNENDKEFKIHLGSLAVGDLVCAEWCDASTGKSRGSGTEVDVPVKSWGIFIGVLGVKRRHIVLAQNSFRFSDGLFDLDYTAIPLSWTVEITVLIKGHIPKETVGGLVDSFLSGGRRHLTRPRTFDRRIIQQRLSKDGRSI